MEMTIQTVAKQLKVTEQYARKLMRDGKIKSQNINRTWITTQKDVNNFLKTGEYVVDPDDRKRVTDEIPNIVALSFFSGGMGMDIGMKNAGINPLLASEINKDARATIASNNNEIGLIGDIWECTADKIREYAKISNEQQIDIIFGGPPCQAFSTAGNRKGFEDARGNVFIRYLNLIGELMPTYVVIENVRGLQTTEAVLDETKGNPVKGGVLHYVIEKLESFGYSVSFELYNAANFGAPQKRERFVIIGKLGNKKVPYLTPTNSENGEYNLPPWKTLQEAIGDIQGTEMNYIKIPESRIEWFKKIPEGGNWKSLSDAEQREAMGAKYFMGGGKTGFFRRLSFSQPSPTLVTVPTMPATDLIHPTELRPLSIEEYARIQGFPDNWVFCGSLLEQYKQIGNAVPIKLGEAIGKTILNDINGINDNIYNTFKYSRYKNTSDITFPILYKQNLEKALKSQESEQILLPI
ncbi:DNA cytosine methyltransferase [Lysinibacillus varians]|uniref:Cytosine-specific methyltransferase n=1 Tax=Lysinibacillus varians TaxID=1145276 RepID=A0ABY2TF50_9BACI|nr:DNA cytosine methyltransferase [Lysinibacillus varians]AHN23122.1 modification methylase [Lysinibacillus varians]TKI66468.1 DNA cytosine methyltransferase [Lysinibacillus varians]